MTYLRILQGLIKKKLLRFTPLPRTSRTKGVEGLVIQNCKTGHINYYYVFEFEMIVVASLQQRVVLYVNRVTAEINPGTEGQIFIRLATDLSAFSLIMS